jgi:phosphoribosylpyrophosphate synthetase
LGLRRLLVTDTLLTAELPGIPVRVVSVAPMLADAISRLHAGRSLGDLLVHDSTP